MPVAMARQSLIFKACALLNGNTKFAYNGITQVNLLVPCMGLKTDAKALKESHKIPEKPKKPLTSYFRYMLEMRPIVSKEDPSLSNRDIVRTIGERWKSLAPEIKSKYEAATAKDQKQYDQEILKYNEKLSPEQEEIIQQIRADEKSEKKKLKIKKESKDEGKPKRAMNSFSLYVKENLTGNKSMIESMKVLKEKWAELSEVEKEKYRMIAQRNREQYKVELAKWEARMIEAGKSHLVRNKTMKDKTE